MPQATSGEFDGRKPLVYLHIPKTAGTSMIEIVSRNFASDEVCRISDVHRPTGEISADIEVAIAEGKRFICGHFRYEAVAHMRDEIDMFTILRDPVDRLVSLYKFWRAQQMDPSASAASRFACDVARSLDFEAFLQCPHPLIVSATRDEMCKTLTPILSQHPAGLDAAELFQAARQTLAGMSYGVVGNFRDSLQMLSEELRLNLLDSVRLNTTDHLPALPLPAATRERATRANFGDAMLFDFASQEFARKKACADTGRLVRDIGTRALTPLAADDRGGFVWDASMAVSGSAWNDREELADGSSYRFTTTPETVAYFPNRFGDRAFEIAVEVLFFHTLGMLDRWGPVEPAAALTFALDGRAIAATAAAHADAGALYRLAVPARRDRGPTLVLALQSPYGVSPALSGSPDTRILAAAVRSIRFAPG